MTILAFAAGSISHLLQTPMLWIRRLSLSGACVFSKARVAETVAIALAFDLVTSYHIQLRAYGSCFAMQSTAWISEIFANDTTELPGAL